MEPQQSATARRLSRTLPLELFHSIFVIDSLRCIVRVDAQNRGILVQRLVRHQWLPVRFYVRRFSTLPRLGGRFFRSAELC
jgi:hypothetical protein